METSLKYEMVRAIIGEILARPDCPTEVTRAWENYHEFWASRSGHWTAKTAGITQSALWEALIKALARHSLMSDHLKRIPL